uniref:Uncharacterized protein n=1 Tax=Anguilla anguilla TaxID=7936 RepID=A0A0E9TS02_ANGAN
MLILLIHCVHRPEWCWKQLGKGPLTLRGQS